LRWSIHVTNEEELSQIIGTKCAEYFNGLLGGEKKKKKN
jgi:hypothetical protein